MSETVADRQAGRGQTGRNHPRAALKNGWQKKTLGQMCQLISGRHIEAKDYNTASRGMGYLTGPSDFGLINPVVSKWTEHPIVKAKKGDILITVKGSGVGKINLLHLDEVAISRQLMAVRVTGADPKYILSYLSSTFDHFQSVSTGAAIPGISREQVLGLEIATPPLPEQGRIVGILDEAFTGIAAARANAEKNLQNAHALFESHLEGVFSKRGKRWVEKTLEEVADANCTLSYGIVQPGAEYLDGLPIVRPTDLTTKVIRLGGLKRIDPKLAGGYKRTALHGGELLLCVRGSTGVVSIASDELAGANVTRGIVPIRFDHSRLAPEFAFHLISSGPVQSQIREKTYGAALMQINIRDLRNITLSFPALNEQKAIAAKLDDLHEETQRLESLYQRKLAAMDELKNSLLHQAFSGLL